MENYFLSAVLGMHRSSFSVYRWDISEILPDLCSKLMLANIAMVITSLHIRKHEKSHIQYVLSMD